MCNHTAWLPGAADGCLFGRLTGNKLMTQLQRMNVMAVEPGPQSCFLNRLLEAFPAEAVEGCARFRVGSWVRNS